MFGLLILGSIEGELVWAASEEYFVLRDDDGPCPFQKGDVQHVLMV